MQTEKAGRGEAAGEASSECWWPGPCRGCDFCTEMTRIFWDVSSTQVLLGGSLEGSPNIVGGRETGSRPLLPVALDQRLAVLASLVVLVDTRDVYAARHAASSQREAMHVLKDRATVSAAGEIRWRASAASMRRSRTLFHLGFEMRLYLDFFPVKWESFAAPSADIPRH